MLPSLSDKHNVLAFVRYRHCRDQYPCILRTGPLSTGLEGSSSKFSTASIPCKSNDLKACGTDSYLVCLGSKPCKYVRFSWLVGLGREGNHAGVRFRILIHFILPVAR